MASNLAEHRLVGAVLKRAIRDIYGHGDFKLLGKEPLAELMRWVLWSDENDPYSFLWCCDRLNLPRDKFGSLFVEVARSRGIELPRGPWVIRVIDGQQVKVIAESVGKSFWRELREERG
jgi:hypothetical protein